MAWPVDCMDRERVKLWIGSHAGPSLSARHGRCQSRQRHSRNLGGAPAHLDVWRADVGDDTEGDDGDWHTVNPGGMRLPAEIGGLGCHHGCMFRIRAHEPWMKTASGACRRGFR